MALSLPDETYQRWREGSRGELSSRFAARRVRPAHRDYTREEPRAEEWLLIEWPESETEPTKYWLSTVAEETSLEDLVGLAKLRWRIERDYRDLKQEVGLDHFEGRGWRGFHHHASLCIAAYGFLVTERCLFPPEQRFQAAAREPSSNWTPRGAGPSGIIRTRSLRSGAISPFAWFSACSDVRAAAGHLLTPFYDTVIL